MKVTLLEIIELPLMAICAIISIFYPKKLQNYYINYCSSRKYMHPFLWFAKSKLFIINSIFFGFVLLLMIAIVILVRIYGIQR